MIKALNRLGATHTMGSYISYITTIAELERPLKPSTASSTICRSDEWVAPDLEGFCGMGPVRVGNQAAEQLQHDAYGGVILGAAQMFIDERLPRMGDATLFERLEPLGAQALRFVSEPDAGLWEYRGRKRIHTHSATMCWVALDRLAHRAAARHRGPQGALARQGERRARGDPEARGTRSAAPSSARSTTTISTPACSSPSSA